MASEKLVRLVILCLAQLAALIILCVVLLEGIGRKGSPVETALVGLAGVAVGSLGTLLSNSGSAAKAENGGTVQIEQAAPVQQAGSTNDK